MLNNIESKRKPSYGIDAPNVIRNLFIIGLIITVPSLVFPIIKIGSLDIQISGFRFWGYGLIVGGSLMLAYSLIGKYIHRDRILNLINWNGTERVLDIGTGKGLLMIGAAKKLTQGVSVGIDIWNEEDLTGNNYNNTIQNAEIEGVGNKVELKNENAMHMSFPDNSFDVVLTNLCLHNIYDKTGRKTACQEIARVLKHGGTAIISDFKHLKEYKNNFNITGFKTKILFPNLLTTFPPLRILIVIKQ